MARMYTLLQLSIAAALSCCLVSCAPPSTPPRPGKEVARPSGAIQANRRISKHARRPSIAPAAVVRPADQRTLPKHVAKMRKGQRSGYRRKLLGIKYGEFVPKPYSKLPFRDVEVAYQLRFDHPEMSVPESLKLAALLERERNVGLSYEQIAELKAPPAAALLLEKVQLRRALQFEREDRNRQLIAQFEAVKQDEDGPSVPLPTKGSSRQVRELMYNLRYKERKRKKKALIAEQQQATLAEIAKGKNAQAGGSTSSSPPRPFKLFGQIVAPAASPHSLQYASPSAAASSMSSPSPLALSPQPKRFKSSGEGSSLHRSSSLRPTTESPAEPSPPSVLPSTHATQKQPSPTRSSNKNLASPEDANLDLRLSLH